MKQSIPLIIGLILVSAFLGGLGYHFIIERPFPELTPVTVVAHVDLDSARIAWVKPVIDSMRAATVDSLLRALKMRPILTYQDTALDLGPATHVYRSGEDLRPPAVSYSFDSTIATNVIYKLEGDSTLPETTKTLIRMRGHFLSDPPLFYDLSSKIAPFEIPIQSKEHIVDSTIRFSAFRFWNPRVNATANLGGQTLEGALTISLATYGDPGNSTKDILFLFPDIGVSTNLHDQKNFVFGLRFNAAHYIPLFTNIQLTTHVGFPADDLNFSHALIRIGIGSSL